MATTNVRSLPDDFSSYFSHTANMADGTDKNGGPNHLRAWRVFRKLSGADLAKLLDITPGMVSELENSKRALSAKWLRRFAPHLRTTPGMLLDHDPNDLDSDIIEIWAEASEQTRRQITGAAKAIARTGTDG